MRTVSETLSTSRMLVGHLTSGDGTFVGGGRHEGDDDGNGVLLLWVTDVSSHGQNGQ